MKLPTAAAFAAFPLIVAAQDHPHPAGEKLGAVRFPTSCAPAVRSQFDRAVALLHSFEFGDAIRAFGQVVSADSSCAMAHWGIALSRWSNPMTPNIRSAPALQEGRTAIDAARRGATRATPREHGYIEAAAVLFDDATVRDQRGRVVAYEKAMGDLVARNPDDTEARIFYALALVGSAAPTDKSYANQLKAGEILERLWAAQPDHPGLAHYIIHAYDVPALAGKARAAAARYATIAPSASHAQHMPSHTFTRVGMWEESVAANRASFDVAMKAGILAEALHALDYRMYAHLQLGNERAAKAILDSLPGIARNFDPTVVSGAAPGSAGVFAIAAIPARWTLERRAWAEAAALEPKASPFPHTEAMTWFARGIGAARTGDVTKARASADTLRAIEKRLSAAGEAYWAEQVAIQALGAEAWLRFTEKREADALALMGQAATREDATEKNAVTPGPLAPARELLADMLLALGKTTEARAEYETVLRKEPNRRNAMRGAAAGR